MAWFILVGAVRVCSAGQYRGSVPAFLQATFHAACRCDTGATNLRFLIQVWLVDFEDCFFMFAGCGQDRVLGRASRWGLTRRGYPMLWDPLLSFVSLGVISRTLCVRSTLGSTRFFGNERVLQRALWRLRRQRGQAGDECKSRRDIPVLPVSSHYLLTIM